MTIANFKIRSWAIVKRLLRECPLLIEVCDARDVPGSRLFKLEAGLRDKLVIAAVKADLVPGKAGTMEKTLAGVRVIYCCTKTREGMDLLSDVLRKMADDKRMRYEAKKRRRWDKAKDGGLSGREEPYYSRADGKTGDRPKWAGGRVGHKHGGGPTVTHDKMVDDSLGIMVFGMPNVGKSSLINALTGRRATQTGFRSGITRGPQWIRLGQGLKLLDTPGVVDLKMVADDMALHASLDAEKVRRPEEVAEQIIDKFTRTGDKTLFRHFGIPYSDDYEAVLEAIARKRGLLGKGGEPHTDEAAKIVIREWQKGKYGLSQKTVKLLGEGVSFVKKEKTEERGGEQTA